MRSTVSAAVSSLLRRTFACSLFTLAAFLLSEPARAAVTFTGPVTEMNGLSPTWVGYPSSYVAISRRPQSALETSITFQNYWIHDLTNQKALEVKVSDFGNGTPAWAYESITLRNLKIHDITRDAAGSAAGLHIDHIRITGAAKQNHAMNVVLENIEIDGGNALPILIGDGIFDTITFRNVSLKDTVNNVQIKMDKIGSINKIIIENSPGLSVALIGRPGSIGDVLVRNSVGARVGDVAWSAGRTGASISYSDGVSDSPSGSPGNIIIAPIPGAIGVGGITPPNMTGPASADGGVLAATPVPEPGTLGLLALALPALLRRRAR